jgi:hypothetical protein
MPDLGVGIVYYYFGIVAPIIMFLPAVLCETVVLRLVLSGRRAFWTALWMNLVTTVIGAVTGRYIAALAMVLTVAITGVESSRVSYDGEYGELVMIIAMAVGWVLSVFVEGVILLLGRGRDRRTVGPAAERAVDWVAGDDTDSVPLEPLHQIWLASLIANSASYALFVVTWLLGTVLF